MKKLGFVLVMSLALIGLNACTKKNTSTSAADASKANTEETTEGHEHHADAKSESKSKSTVINIEHPVSAHGITVYEAVACKGVRDRIPVDAAEAFSSDVGRVFLFSKVGVEDGGEASIKHVWKFNGEEQATMTLPVRGPSWRTYSSKAIMADQKGKWTVEISTNDGNAVKTVEFAVE